MAIQERRNTPRAPIHAVVTEEFQTVEQDVTSVNISENGMFYLRPLGSKRCERKEVFLTFSILERLEPIKVLGWVVEEIEKVKNKSDFVVVYTHWGLEYHLRESESQKNLAHMFVDAGADVIIGSHPHVVQPIEIYKEKVIFYSLGNLVFDQYFSALAAFGYKYIPDQFAVEDMVQEAFISFWEKRTDFDHINAIKSFLFIEN